MFLQVSHPQSQGLTERFKLLDTRTSRLLEASRHASLLLQRETLRLEQSKLDRRTALPASWLRTTLPCHSAEDTGPERLGSDHLAPQGVGRCSSTVADGAGAAEGILRQQERGATL